MRFGNSHICRHELNAGFFIAASLGGYINRAVLIERLANRSIPCHARAPPPVSDFQKIQIGGKKVKTYYVMVGGERIPVSEEIYRTCLHFRNKESYAYRKKRKGVELSFEMLRAAGVPFGDDSDTTQDTAMVSILLKQMMDAVKKLDEEDRLIIHQLFFQELSMRELARRIGVSDRTVRYRRDRALRKIKKYMKI
jgi:RNA polymerase sigma factor (sigma-70 family)